MSEWSATRRSRYYYRHPDAIMSFSATWSPEEAMNKHLDVLESVLIMVRQRPMTEDQIDRYARILAAAEADAVRR